MKLTLLPFVAVASAWSLGLYTTGGRLVTKRGEVDSGCVALVYSPTLKINRVTFDKTSGAVGSILGEPTTFQLYTTSTCSGVAYTGTKADQTISPAKLFKAYKVY